MKKTKLKKFSQKSTKIFFSVALFILVFGMASVVKIQAGSSDSVTGWLWGGTDDGVGNTTNVGWISANSTNTGAPVSYGINVPSSDGNVSGYAWSENIGWISFNSSDLTGCPLGTCNARREGDYLKGWARIIGIKTELVAGNSGGWEGWISLDDKNGTNKYGIQISKMLGVGSGSHTYAWSDELGWIDFGQAKVKNCPAISCATRQVCSGSSFSSCDSTFCSRPSGDTDVSCSPSGTSWTCDNGCGTTINCSASLLSDVDGACGDWNGCSNPTGDYCSSGTRSNLAENNYESSWDCEGQCGGTDVHCSANGLKSCGWIETNP
ncbi:MAG: hypothetical protein PHF35_01720 [Candidatus Moranbacteria bacterium]|nr:hypothetical protein [Candidatus Moranbacteria bacterium]